MGTELKSVMRNISIGVDALDSSLTPARMNEMGFVLKDKRWEKKIPVLQFVSEEHSDGGVPKVEQDVTQDQFLDLMNQLSEQPGVLLSSLLETMNNGLYLAANAKAKPKAVTGIKAMQVVFVSHATEKEKSEWMSAIVNSAGDDYVKAWFAKRK